MSTSIAFSWRQALTKSDLPGEARHLLLTLSLYMNEMGEGAYPALTTLAKDCGKSDRWVKKWMAIARKSGWIDVRQVKITKKDADNRGWKRNQYFARWPDRNIAILPGDPEQSDGLSDKDLSDLKAEKGSARGALPSANGGARNEKGGARNDKKVVHDVHTNSPENLSNESLQRADAPEREDEKKIEREFKAFAPLWPTWVSDSAPAARKAWFALTSDERAQAVDRFEDYLDEGRKAGRKQTCSLGVYLREKRWEKLGAKKPERAGPVTLAPYGKAWMAERMHCLKLPRRTWMPSGFAKERPDLFVDSRRRAEYPEVARMEQEACRKPPDWAGFDTDNYKQVRVGSDQWTAWADWHEVRDLPFLSPNQAIEFVWFPQGDPQGFELEGVPVVNVSMSEEDRFDPL